MASGLCIGMLILNLLITGCVMGARSAIHGEGAVPRTWMAVTLACANLIAAPILAIAICCIKEGREAWAIVVSTLAFAGWGSATLGLFEYVLRSDYRYVEYRGQAAGLLLTPTIVLIVLGLACWFFCDCVCCEPDVEAAIPPLANYHPPEKMFSSSSWMRRGYSSVPGTNTAAGRSRS